MIRTIPNIKAFGVFSGFQWHAGLPEFKQFNLIYGWNYSGKTTLSRAFRCFEQRQPHSDFAKSVYKKGTSRIAEASDHEVYHSEIDH
jgi:wobble nucleotide-excising tRNase